MAVSIQKKRKIKEDTLALKTYHRQGQKTTQFGLERPMGTTKERNLTHDVTLCCCYCKYYFTRLVPNVNIYI